MEMKENTPERIIFISDMDISLANAIRRNVNEIPILAVEEVDIYKNDSALYDEIISQRLGLTVLKNQKLKKGRVVEMKLKSKGEGERTEVLAKGLGDNIVHPETPIVLLEDGQELELVAKTKVGKGIMHAKFSPGVIFYKHLPKIKISEDGEKHIELAEIYPNTFEKFGDKLKVKNSSAGDFDLEDMEKFNGINIKFDDDLVLMIEAWGQIEAKEIFSEACKALKANLSEVSKVLK
jgi:DNA-directed RNA polymerase subunit D